VRCAVDDTREGHTDSFSQQAGSSHESNTTSSGHTVHRDKCTAFVSNLDFSVTADQLREIFCKVCMYVCDVLTFSRRVGSKMTP